MTEIDTGGIWMKLLTMGQIETLINNNTLNPLSEDNIPEVYLRTESGSEKWLISEIVNNEEAFGIHAQKDSLPEIGLIKLNKLDQLIKNGEIIFNDLSFATEYSLKVFNLVAEDIGFLVTDERGYTSKFQKALRK